MNFELLIPIALFARDLLRLVTLESLATLFYVHNIFFPPLLGSAQYMGQMWSLSLEEQFYLLGAVATYLAIKRMDRTTPAPPVSAGVGSGIL